MLDVNVFVSALDVSINDVVFLKSFHYRDCFRKLVRTVLNRMVKRFRNITTNLVPFSSSIYIYNMMLFLTIFQLDDIPYHISSQTKIIKKCKQHSWNKKT